MAGEQRVDEKHQFIPEDYFRELKQAELFEGDRPLELDVGCGDGRFLLEMAQHFPERNFLGLERLLGRVRKVCRRAAREDLNNVKVLRLESSYALEYLLPAKAFDRLHLLFPDPWPKKRHHSRRIVRPEILPAFARVLADGGEFLFKTDHPPYFEEALETIEASKRFCRLEWEEDAFYPQTDFEAHWLGQGKAIHRARFKVRD
jgi:tRNA (guanine-N7-)-methyltransferase